VLPAGRKRASQGRAVPLAGRAQRAAGAAHASA
jgi:hypothetical protein